MKKNTILSWICLLSVVLFFSLPIQIWIRVILGVLGISGFFFFKRWIIYFFVANRLYSGKKPDLEKAMHWFERSWKAGAPPRYLVMIGNVFALNGDAMKAATVLQYVLDVSQGTENAHKAAVILSMALWRLENRDRAISLLTDTLKRGYGDKNLFVNLESYLMEEGRYKEAKHIIDKGKNMVTESAGMMDNRGWYYLVMAQWQEAQQLYEELIIDRKPMFPEAYVHAAQVAVHFSEREKARKLLKTALEKNFQLTTTIRPEYITMLLTALSGKNWEQGMAFFEAHVMQIAKGEEVMTDFLQTEVDDEDELVMVVDDDWESEDVNFDLTEDDEREHSTDLGEDDEWFDDEDDYEEIPDEFPEIDEDDEREHSTDLTDDDDVFDDDDEEID